MSERKRRLSVYLTDDMYKKVEKLSAEMGLSLSAVAILALYQFEQQNAVLPMLPFLQSAIEEEGAKKE